MANRANILDLRPNTKTNYLLPKQSARQMPLSRDELHAVLVYRLERLRRQIDDQQPQLIIAECDRISFLAEHMQRAPSELELAAMSGKVPD